MIESVLDTLNTSTNRIYLRDFKKDYFINLSEAHINIKYSDKNYVLLKFKNPITYAPIEQKEVSAKMPIGKLHALFSANIDIGYIFELPKCKLECDQRYYMYAIQKESTLYKNVSLWYATKKLSIFGPKDGSGILAVLGRKSSAKDEISQDG